MNDPSLINEDDLWQKVQNAEPFISPVEPATSPEEEEGGSPQGEPSMEPVNAPESVDKTIPENRQGESSTGSGEIVDRGGRGTADDGYDALREKNNEMNRALASGAALTADSLLNAPEFIYDTVTGQIPLDGQWEPEWTKGSWAQQKIDEMKETYDTKTWWGNIISYGTHFGTMALALRKVPGLGGKGAIGGAVAGAATDIASTTRNDETASTDIVDSQILTRIPHIGGQTQWVFDNTVGKALYTKDTDNTYWRTFKNVVEGIGLDAALGSVIKWLDPDGTRKASTEAQKVESAKAEIEDDVRLREINLEQQQLPGEAIDVEATEVVDPAALPGNQPPALPPTPPSTFRANKNAEIADLHQGNHMKSSKPADVFDQAQELGSRPDVNGAGSTDGVFTSRQLENMANSTDVSIKEMKRIMKELVSDDRWRAMKKELADTKTTFAEKYGKTMQRYQEFMGRNFADMEPDEFWAPLMDDMDMIRGIEVMSPENIAVVDLVNASLFKQMRDLGIASREIMDHADIMDVDGPMQAIRDRLIVGMSHAKASRYVTGKRLKEFDVRVGKSQPKTAKEAIEALTEESKQAVSMYFENAVKAKDDSVVRALAEAFSLSDKIRNFDDLDAYFRSKMGHSKMPGTKWASARLIKELGGVMMHSVLTGFKTPTRAILGTNNIAFTRQLGQLFGAVMEGDARGIHASLASLNAYRQAVPEALSLFNKNLSAYWTGDIADVKTRFTDGADRANDEWALYMHWAETRGTDADQAAAFWADNVRQLNNNNFLTYNTKIMGAADDAFTLLMARADARYNAMLDTFDARDAGTINKFDLDTFKEYEQRNYNQLLDEDGNINVESDLFMKSTVQDATLTTDLRGFSQHLQKAFDAVPPLKPWFMFARTGINGLNRVYKDTPVVGMLHKEFFDIMSAKPGDLTNVRQYGITNARELRRAKQIYKGRQAWGVNVTTVGASMYLAANLTGSGPEDRRIRQTWIDNGWQPNMMTLPGGIQISYQMLEPYNSILSAIADIGDNQKLMGPEWAEKNLATIALIVAGSATSKSYLQGMQGLVDLAAGDTYQIEKMVGNIMNNQIPLAGLRNDLGKLINPAMRELNKGIWESIRNRNLGLEYLPGEDLPVKWDLLSKDKKVRDWNPIESFYNMISPIPLRMEPGPGRNMLFNSNFNLRLATFSLPETAGGPVLDLSDHPELRSQFQYYINQQNLEPKLDALAEDPKMIQSMKDMGFYRDNGSKDFNPMKFPHNQRIKQLFDKARAKAAADLLRDPKYGPKLRELYGIERNRAAAEQRAVNAASGQENLTPNSTDRLLLPTR